MTGKSGRTLRTVTVYEIFPSILARVLWQDMKVGNIRRAGRYEPKLDLASSCIAV
jgi:hypothetical protein